MGIWWCRFSITPSSCCTSRSYGTQITPGITSRTDKWVLDRVFMNYIQRFKKPFSVVLSSKSATLGICYFQKLCSTHDHAFLWICFYKGVISCFGLIQYIYIYSTSKAWGVKTTPRLISDGNVWELEIRHESSPRYVISKNTKVYLSRQYFFVIITTQTCSQTTKYAT